MSFRSIYTCPKWFCQDIDIRQSSIQSTLVVYYEKIRTSGIYIHDVSFISPYALLFFGKTQTSAANSTTKCDNSLLVDNWIEINIDNETNKLVYGLKDKFNYWMERKAMEKNVFLENEQELLETIVHFITKQDRNLVLQNKLIDDYDKTTPVYEDWDNETKE